VVLIIALSCELKDFVAIVYTKENVAAKALADQLSDLAPPTIRSFGWLIGRMEEGKGEAYASKIDVRCSDRNKIIAYKNVLIATGGSARAEMAMRCSTFGHWISRTWLAFMDESQQYGNNMRLQLSLPFNNQLSLSSLAITGKLQDVKRPSSGCQSTQTVATAVRAQTSSAAGATARIAVIVQD